MKFTCDIRMILAIDRIHNLPPHLYVPTLPDITQNWNTALTSWSRGSWTLGTVFVSIIDEASDKHGCMHVYM